MNGTHRTNPFAMRFLIVLATLCVVNGISLYAQSVKFRATLDTNTILIGGQTALRLQVEYPSGVTVMFPAVADTVDNLRKVEIVERSRVDSTAEHDGITQRQSLMITAFDSGSYQLPPIALFYRKASDTTLYRIESEPLALNVRTIKVDTAQGLKDIKAPLEVPITFAELLPYIAGGVAVVALIAAVAYYIRKRRLEPDAEPEIIVPSRPPFEVALEALEALKQERVWQQGGADSAKEYHTQLTDILRVYVERSFGVKAMEATSDEILQQYRTSLKPSYVPPGTSELLRFVLEQADLVKFARLQPTPDDHEKSWNVAREFVIITKPSESFDNMETASVAALSQEIAPRTSHHNDTSQV